MIIGVLNQKGGVGKTTISINLAAALSEKGGRVLLVDGDPQGSSLDWSAAREKEKLFTVVGLPRSTIHKEMESLSKGYDYVVIDGPPRVTDLARSAIIASDLVVIPVQPSPYDIWAAEEVINIIREASLFKENLKSSFVVNRKISNTAIGRDVNDALSSYETHVFKNTINQRVIYAEAAAQGESIFEVDTQGVASKEFKDFVNELLEFMNE